MHLRLVVTGVIITLMGCGPAPVVKAKLYPVKGRVTVNGQPISGCQIMLTPIKVDKGADDGYVGTLNDEGKFELSSVGGKAGAAAGKYKVVMKMPLQQETPQQVMERMKAGRMPEAPKEPPYPSEYGHINTTTKEVEITRDSNDLLIAL